MNKKETTYVEASIVENVELKGDRWAADSVAEVDDAIPHITAIREEDGRQVAVDAALAMTEPQHQQQQQ